MPTKSTHCESRDASAGSQAVMEGSIGQIVEICGCTQEQARQALEAAAPGGVDVAVDLILSSMSSHWASAANLAPAQPLKLVCLVRRDLGMGVGKVAAQVAHGALGAYRATLSKGADGQALLQLWEQGGEAAIVLGVADEPELRSKLDEAEQAGLTTHLIADAGRTEVAAGSVTVGTIGPAAVDRIDAITGRLALL